LVVDYCLFLAISVPPVCRDGLATGESLRSILSKQGSSREAMQRQLDRKDADCTVEAYARSEHLPERRKMMPAWADTCDSLETGGEVIPLHGKTA
jgi:hypothetical protein